MTSILDDIFDFSLPIRQSRVDEVEDNPDQDTYMVYGEVPDVLVPQGNPILVWRFYQAPVWMASLSPHGGDEDWVAYLPPEYDGEFVWWTNKLGYHVSAHYLADGGRVLIGAHA